MKASDIKPGQHYRAVDIYEKEVIQVLVIEASETVEDHWVCRRPDGRKVLLPSSAFMRPMPPGK
jgi:hypothetical protein